MNKKIFLYITIVIVSCSKHISYDNYQEVAWIHAIINYEECYHLYNQYNSINYTQNMMHCLNEGIFWINDMAPETLFFNKIYNNSDTTCTGIFKFNSDTVTFHSQHCNNNISKCTNIIHNTNHDYFKISSDGLIIDNSSFETGYGYEKNLIINYKYIKYGCTDTEATNYNSNATHLNNDCRYKCHDNNTLISPINCTNLVSLLGCDNKWETTEIENICPVTCNSSWCYQE